VAFKKLGKNCFKTKQKKVHDVSDRYVIMYQVVSFNPSHLFTLFFNYQLYIMSLLQNIIIFN